MPVSKRRLRKMKPWEADERRLVIHVPRRQYLSRQKAVTQPGVKGHVRRGHIRRYGRDGRGLLFGKWKRDVYIPQCYVGDVKIGLRVTQEYEIKSGK